MQYDLAGGLVRGDLGEIERSNGCVRSVRYFKCERRSVASQPFWFPFHALPFHPPARKLEMAGSDHLPMADTVGSCDQSW